MRWMGFAEILTHARARKGEAQGVLSYQKVKGIFDNPQLDFWDAHDDSGGELFSKSLGLGSLMP